MQFAHSEEQRLIRESARDFLAARAGPAQRRTALEQPGAYDAQLWREMAGTLGWAGLAIASEHGGAGLGWVELCILQEEQGRYLVPSPFFSTVALAAPLIEAAGSAAQRHTLLGRIARGELRIGCVLSGVDGRPPSQGVAVELGSRGEVRTLNGVGDFVIHADSADLLLVLARAPGSAGAEGLSIAMVSPSAAGVAIHPHVMLDLTRPMSRIEFTDVTLDREQILGETGAASGPAERAFNLARIALASEALGSAERLLEMTIGDPDLSGTHEGAPDGFLMAYGATVSRARLLPRGSVVDVVPTLLYFLGLPIGRDMDGYARTDVFQRGYTDERPITFIPTYDR